MPSHSVWSDGAGPPEGAVGAGGGRGLLGRGRDGALLLLLAQCVHGRLVVGAAGAAVVGRGLVADGAQAGAGERPSQGRRGRLDRPGLYPL